MEKFRVTHFVLILVFGTFASEIQASFLPPIPPKTNALENSPQLPQPESNSDSETQDDVPDSPQFPSRVGPLGVITPENVLVPIDQEILQHKNRVKNRRDAKNENFSGVVLVAQGPNVLFRQAYGSDPNSGKLYDANSSFLLSSATKQFTAALILKETEKENPRIRLDDPMSKFFDRVPVSWNDVTVEKLLTHTAGFGEYMLPTRKTRPCRAENSGFFIDSDLISKKIMRFKPCKIYKDNYVYTNTNYFLLAKILERVTGKSYSELFSEEIARPLGMSRSGAKGPNDPGSSFKLYGEDGVPLLNGLGIWYLGVGNIYSSIDDILKWEVALFGDDANPEHKVLSDASLESMITPKANAAHFYLSRVPKYPGEDLWRKVIWKNGKKVGVQTNYTEEKVRVSYGYGLRIVDLDGGKHLVFHSGHINGHTSLIAHYIEDKITIIILTNTNHAEVFGLEGEIAKTVFGLGGLKPRQQDQRLTQNIVGSGHARGSKKQGINNQ